MEDPNIILTIAAGDLPAENALRLPHNQQRHVPCWPNHGVREIASREPTPCPGFEGDSCRLQLTFDKKPKDIRHGFVFGSDPRTCDVIVGTREMGISRQHFCITFDDNARLILKDISRGGTAVSYGGEAEKERRRHFTWILFDDYELKVHLNIGERRSTFFFIKLESHDTCKAEYLGRLKSYLKESHEAIPSMGLLDIHSQASTAAPSQPLSPKQPSIYLLGEPLGSGTFGTVYCATDVSTAKVFAAKKFDRGYGFEMEVEILKALSHEHVVQFVEFSDEPDHLLIMEYVPLGNLASQHSASPLTIEEQVHNLLQGLQAIEYLHDRKITHRDIKPENILVQSRGDSFHIKLADFGLSKNSSFLKTLERGTPVYMAPEVCGLRTNSNTSTYTNKVDIWSLGVVALRYAGGLPVTTSLVAKNYLGWCWDVVEYIGDLIQSVDTPIFRLAIKMLQIDPQKRPSASECLFDASIIRDSHSGSVTPTKDSGPSLSAAQVVQPSSKRQHSSSKSATGRGSSSCRRKRFMTTDGTVIWRPPEQSMKAKVSGPRATLRADSDSKFVNVAGRSGALNKPEATGHSYSTQSSLLSTQSAEANGVTYPDEFRDITKIPGLFDT